MPKFYSTNLNPRKEIEIGICIVYEKSKLFFMSLNDEPFEKSIMLEVQAPNIDLCGNEKPLFLVPSELFTCEWLIYKIPDWVCDHCISKCMICDVNFTFTRRRVSLLFFICYICPNIICEIKASLPWMWR